jgi:hypothetical protein
MTKESRGHNLFLNSTFIAVSGLASIDNRVGGWTNTKQITYYNIDLKQLLGSDWDKYETFKITLKGISNQFSTEQLNAIFISGLNFINSSYNPVTQNNSNRSLLCCHRAIAAHNLTTYSDDIALCFSKGEPYVRIQFEMVRVSDNVAQSPTIMAYLFEVKGVETELI